MGSRKVAVLIDSENTPHSKLSSIIEELQATDKSSLSVHTATSRLSNFNQGCKYARQTFC
ncbi:hypothetical protein VagYM19_15940 [Vibrio alginolyticus]|nr:hypothetical protein Vag1382_15930 [Vibrio alginolyticus]BCB47067.1 hypothetical protein VagVIO5_15930 [Vibrio alginolyticus]BCB51668.1 hypothetical protein VagYM19_15940 [Vibrio alginolyticus]BCB56271.1 hypothetical protein VagYM4_15940 [Vibrio alginolyticus]